MPFFVYLARCNDSSLYTGSCVDIHKREAKHNKGAGAKYTKQRLPVKIVYSEEIATLTEARQREAQIKKWSKTKKENLTKYGHPTKYTKQ